MTDLNSQLYYKIQSLNQNVKQRLKKKGLVLPVKNKDGSIKIGLYTIIKNKNRSYSIRDEKGFNVVENINLLHSAITIANGLATKHFLDKSKVDLDYQYGYSKANNLHHKTLAIKYIKNNKIDQAEVMLAKSSLSQNKAEQIKKTIVSEFEKLLMLDK